jgi:hypothetical protein
VYSNHKPKCDNYTELINSTWYILSKLMGGSGEPYLQTSPKSLMICFPTLSTVLQGRTNCFYQGEVSERPDWQVVVNLCKGLS